MTIRALVDTNGQDVAIFSVPYHFSTNDLAEKVSYSVNRAWSRDKTYLCVIDYDYQVLNMTDQLNLLDKFSWLDGLPRQSPEFRIAIVGKYDINFYRGVSALFEEGNVPAPKSRTDWLTLLIVGGLIAAGTYLDANSYAERVRTHPIANDPWIQVRPNLQAGIRWVRANATWL